MTHKPLLISRESKKWIFEPEQRQIRANQAQSVLNHKKRGEIASSTMKIAAEKSRSTACSSATVTETRSTSQLKNIRPNYFVSLPIKNENIKWAIKIFEEFFKKNASGMTGYQKVQTLAVVLSSRALRTNFRSFKIIWFLGTLDGGGVSSGRK